MQGPAARRAIHLVLDLQPPDPLAAIRSSVGIPTAKVWFDMALRLTVKMTSVNSGPLNYALCGFTFDPGGPINTTTALAMRCFGYIQAVGQSCMEEQCYVDSITETNAPVSGGTDIAFDTVAYEAMRAGAAVAGITLRDTAAWGVQFLGRVNGTSSGRGDSICMQTKTTAPGRKGRGRHFIPFTNREAIAANGLINTGVRDLLEDAYKVFFLGKDLALPATGAVVLSKLPVGTMHPITGCKLTMIPSRLKSRTR